MLKDSEILEAIANMFNNDAELTPCVRNATNCLIALNTIMPSLNQADALIHFKLLMPNISISTYSTLNQYLNQSTPEILANYFQKFHDTLSQPEVQHALSEAMKDTPDTTEALFGFAGMLHETYSCGMKIQAIEAENDDNLTIQMSMAVDLLKISHLLKNVSLVIHHLENIDSELAKEKESQPEHATSRFFFRWSQNNHFDQDKYAILKGFLNDQDQFFDLLRDKTTFKDKGVDPYHGAWTHLIQLYIISEQNKKSKFLENNPAEIYAYLAKAACRGKKPYLSWDKNQLNKRQYEKVINVFDLFFDRSEIMDARTPTFITMKMMGIKNSKILASKTNKSVNKKRPRQKKQLLKNEVVTHVLYPKK